MIVDSKVRPADSTPRETGMISQLGKPQTTTFLRPRDVPSALAKDIASRRGIPASQRQQSNTSGPSYNAQITPIAANLCITSSPSQKSRPTSPEARRRSSTDQKSTKSDHGDRKPITEDGFSRFYADLTSNPLAKLSSMLAFAGLPLVDTDVEPHTSQSAKTTTRASAGPDVTRMFSKAALRALDDKHRHPGNMFGPGESFYVIPTSGGTASYANVLTKDSQRVLNSSKTDEIDEFVDAKEVLTEGDGRAKPSDGLAGGRTLREEELQTENAALKQILDKLSHRLQAFESHAQDASMQALTQSMISVRAGSTIGQSEMEERLKAMTIQLEREMKERKSLSAENTQQKQVITKMKGQWEDLKDSARAKEKAKREAALAANIS